MKVISKRPRSLVVANSQDSITKYYKLQAQWQQEKTNLNFLAQLKVSGVTLGCTTPRIIESSEVTEFIVDNHVYTFSNTMQRIHGFPADSNPAKQHPESWVPALATAIYNLHNRSRPYVADWIADHGKNDALLLHIMNDKVSGILEQNPDTQTKRYIEHAAQYLQKKLPTLAHQQTLSHQDINLSNVLVNRDNSLVGVVDWVTFGLTHPTLSIYQLATNPKVWGIFQEEYIKCGGVISFDILYAASAIHIAWANVVWEPIIARGMDTSDTTNETMERFEEIYEHFRAASLKI